MPLVSGTHVTARVSRNARSRRTLPPLHRLSGHEVALVVSRRDSRRSRRGDPEPSPVKREALELGLQVTDDLDQVTGVGAELGVVVAYGRIIPERILDPLPMVNVHFSLLPRWRGAAPVERAIPQGMRPPVSAS